MRILLIVTLAVLITGCGSEADKPPATDNDIPLPPVKSSREEPRVQQAVHSDAVTGIRFALPAGWIVRQNKEGLTFMAPTPEDQDPAMGYTRSLPTGDDGKVGAFETTADLVIARMRKVEPSAKDFKKTPITVAGKKALLISFTMDMEGASYVWKQVMIGEDAAGGLVQFSYPGAGEDLYAPVFKAILDTLELPEGKPAETP